MQRKTTLFGICILISLVLAGFSCSSRQKARQIFDACDFSGGLVVHLGCGDGKLTAAMGRGKGVLVQGLDSEPENVTTARQWVQSRGLYGKVTVDRLVSDDLPYIDNLVNLIVAEKPGRISRGEMMRVLRPNGVAYIISQKTRQKIVKPYPKDIDDWTHYLYDAGGNAVSKDKNVGPPQGMQWVGGPRWSRHHDKMSSLSALVSANGRIFYIIDEGNPASIALPPKWALMARDGFNGTVLWKRPIEKWHIHLWPLKSGPAQLPRRLVARDDKVYVTLGLDAVVSVLDAASGKTLYTVAESEGTEEMVLSGGILYLLVNPDFDDSSLVRQYHKGYSMDIWDREERTILAADAATGAVLWKTSKRVVPGTLAADDTRLYFHNGESVESLDITNGTGLWTSEPVPTSAKMMGYFIPNLIVHENVVLYAGGEKAGDQTGGWSRDSDDMTALSKKTGEILWTKPHPASGYRSPEDLFVIDDLVWAGETTSGRAEGEFVGRDLAAGSAQIRFEPDVDTYWFHHRCYRSKATENYILTSRTGVEFVDPQTGHWDINHWVRGSCLYGIMPANGMLYAPPSPCACYMEAKLNGFNALRPAAATAADQKSRLQKGPAFDKVKTDGPAGAWPTYRGDARRSGSTNTPVAADLENVWEMPVGGKLSAVVIGDGQVFVTAIDRHTLHVLDAASGAERWRFTAGGRIDSPPTVYRGKVLFGSADGFIYALRASDGELCWRFRAAPADRRLVSYNQVESVWPVHGNVLVQDDVLYAVAGRSMFLDGGVRFYRLDPNTGEVLSESVLDEKDESGKDLHEYVSWLNMPTAAPDILSSDGKLVYMRSQPFLLDGTRLPLQKMPKAADADRGAPPATQVAEHAHLFCPSGYLDDTWWHRTYWVYGSTYVSGWCGYFLAFKKAPAGRLLVFNDDRVFGFGRKPVYYGWTTPLEYHLYAAKKHPAVVQTKEKLGWGNQKIDFEWSQNIPLLVRAMVLSQDHLYVAGPPDLVDEEKVFETIHDPATRELLLEQNAALEGDREGRLWVISSRDGEKKAGYRLAAPPVWDGMAAADGRLYLALMDGSVVCLAGTDI